MKSLVSRILLSGGTMLTLASLFIFLAPCVEAANGPFNGKIAFETDRDGNKEIYVMNADGTGQVNISNNPALDANPYWSPDGTKITFDSNRDGNFEIYVMNADGSNQTRLTFNTATDSASSWSPDGTKIAFQSFRDGNFEIYVMNADGTNQTRLTNNSAKDLFPKWSPDGKQIVFQSNRDGNDEIYVMDTNGANQTRLTNNTADDFVPNWQPLVPVSTVGVFRPSTGQWLLRNSNTSGAPDITLSFGQQGDLPVTGDWDGDGRTDIGVYRGSTFFLALLKSGFIRVCPTCPLVLITFIDPQPSFTC